jgi:transposase, IS4 family
VDIDTFKDDFSAVDDNPQSAKITYPLFDLLFASLYAVIAGSKGWYEIREYILGHHEWFKRNCMFKDGIPTDDTIAHPGVMPSYSDDSMLTACNWPPVIIAQYSACDTGRFQGS